MDRGIEPSNADDDADVSFQPNVDRAVQMSLTSGARVCLQLQPDTVLEGEEIPFAHTLLRGRELPGEDTREPLHGQPDPTRRLQ